jgi:hypothetical protein
LLLLCSIICEETIPIDYRENNIDDMRPGFIDTKDDGIYYLEHLNLPAGHKIVAFADMAGCFESDDSDETNSKQTGIITYIKENNDYIFYFNKYIKSKMKFEEVQILKIENVQGYKIRNFFIGSLNDDMQYCYIVSFIKEDIEMKHYVNCDGGKQIYELKKGTSGNELINSNILILNKDEDNFHSQIVYQDENKINLCIIGQYGYCAFKREIDTLNNGEQISKEGGMAYADITGNCVPDILLSIDDDSDRKIRIYTVDSENNIKFQEDIKLGNKHDLGAFAISKINDKEDIEENDSALSVPLLDIFIPNITSSKIIHYKNKVSKNSDWVDDYCEIHGKDNIQGNIFGNPVFYSLEEKTLVSPYPTMIRFGDFLSKSTPGIITTQKVNEEKNEINLYKVDSQGFHHYNTFDIDKFTHETGDKFEMGLFYDIEESGSMSMILCTEKGHNYFFFNKQKNKFFIKSKLISQPNNKKGYFDTNLGATFRYIYTDEKGRRHMDVSFQMVQYSDMNIPIPYSFMGLFDTSYYIDYYHSISGNHYTKKEKFLDEEVKNWRQDTPIIPNTQMMIFKFKDPEEENLIRWDIDLFVQPMDKLYVILIIVVLVLLIVLGIIIYLHVKETKEEQKEQNKFKSWFA